MGFYNFTRSRYTLYGDHCPPAKSGTGVFRKHNGLGKISCVYILGCIHSNCNVGTGPLKLLHCRHTVLRQVQPSHGGSPSPCLIVLHNGMHWQHCTWPVKAPPPLPPTLYSHHSDYWVVHAGPGLPPPQVPTATEQMCESSLNLSPVNSPLKLPTVACAGVCHNVASPGPPDIM